jgi:hypothetical protein
MYSETIMARATLTMESKGATGMIIKKIQQNKSKMRKQKVNKKVNYQ